MNLSEEDREKAKAILDDLLRGNIYKDCAVDRLAALLSPPRYNEAYRVDIYADG